MYQPRISEENIQRLYQLKIQKQKPMTHVLDDIINDYFDSNQEGTQMEVQKKSSKDMNS
jgi:transcription termination factor NusB